MLGENIGEVGWPASGEIDIMENVGREPSVLHASLHGPGFSAGNSLTASNDAARRRLARALSRLRR